MAKLKDARLYGGVGAVLTLVGGFVPFVGYALSIAGIILVLIAVKYISDSVKDRKIFKNYLISFLLSIFSIIAVVGTSLLFIGFTALTPLSSPMRAMDMNTMPDIMINVIIAFCSIILLAWAFAVVSAFYLKKSYDTIAHRTGVELFRSTALVYFIGVITSIILVGIIIVLVAKIMEIIAYFSLPDTPHGFYPSQYSLAQHPYPPYHPPYGPPPMG